jgi:hypothetical protein
MSKLFKIIYLSIFLSISCSQEYGFTSPQEKVTVNNLHLDNPHFTIDDTPEIEVSPTSIILKPANVIEKETVSETITITNIGTGLLDVSLIQLRTGTLFSLKGNEPRAISTQESETFRIVFEPTAVGFQSEMIGIYSNDKDEPVTSVPVLASADAPKILVTPTYHNYGNPFVGCPEEVLTSIKNIGNADLRVDRITYSATLDTSFSIMTIYGESPWIISPGDEILGLAAYAAYDEVYDISYLTVESNDPTNPVVVAEHRGDAIRAGTQTDTFIQEENEKVDILFVVDNSCSMSEDQTSLSTNSIAFITELDAGGADYHIAVITTDNPSFRGPVLYPGHPDLILEFQRQLVAGVSGSATEKGLEMAHQATSLGGDAATGGSFQRSDAVLGIVFVSDEDDYSILDVSSHYVPHFQNLKLDPSMVLLHAVAEDPFDAVSCAYDAYRYIDAVNLTGGIFASICTVDWSFDLETIAEDSLIPNLDFQLSEIPLESTLAVTVNGIPAIGWHYNPATNSVVFASYTVPIKDDVVEVTYGHFGKCN